MVVIKTFGSTKYLYRYHNFAKFTNVAVKLNEEDILGYRDLILQKGMP